MIWKVLDRGHKEARGVVENGKKHHRESEMSQQHRDSAQKVERECLKMSSFNQLRTIVWKLYVILAVRFAWKTKNVQFQFSTAVVDTEQVKFNWAN